MMGRNIQMKFTLSQWDVTMGQTDLDNLSSGKYWEQRWICKLTGSMRIIQSLPITGIMSNLYIHQTKYCKIYHVFEKGTH